jgi:DUF1016 N-terminal domain
MKIAKTTKKRSTKAATAIARTRVSPAVALVESARVTSLVRELGALIEGARKQVAGAANAVLTLLHWQVGDRVHTEVLKQRRAEYGAEIVATASRQLEKRYGRGFNEKSLRRMVQFTSGFPDAKIVATIELVALRRSDPYQRPTKTRFLRRDVSSRTLECARATSAD